MRLVYCRAGNAFDMAAGLFECSHFFLLFCCEAPGGYDLLASYGGPSHHNADRLCHVGVCLRTKMLSIT
eukprot:6277677-Amphidinium_carterae.1